VSGITRLIDAIGHDDPRAAAELLPLVYDELRKLARLQIAREGAGHTLQATALVHEAYLRLIDDQPDGWDGRRHFFAAAAEAMRRILIEHARHKHTAKRGGKRERVDLDDEMPAIAPPIDGIDLLAVDEAMQRLAAEDASMAELVKLSFFAGLSLDEAASVMGISRATVYRQWAFARAWLHRAMSS
jgi:RNA polymerase sigma factor (TIGR02999 family)